ncbi:MAG: hypothetical protein KF864_09385 [Phycisphaeraceae bacterium]|nr:hypothetical protein [Phycisphaeraceae bacterium]
MHTKIRTLKGLRPRAFACLALTLSASALPACSTAGYQRPAARPAPAAAPTSAEAALFPRHLVEQDALAFSNWAPEFARRPDLAARQEPSTPYDAEAWPAAARADLNAARRLTLPHRPETIIYFNTNPETSRPRGWWRDGW